MKSGKFTIPWLSVLIITAIMAAGCNNTPMTSKKLVSKCAEALGGQGVIDKIDILYIKAVYPDHGDIPMEIIIKRPNKSYNPRSHLVFDGEKIAFLKGRNGHSKPEFAPQGDWKDGEVEIAYHFPAFFDHPSEYLGTENINGQKVHQLQVKLPLGGVITYIIDSENFLVSQVMFRFDMNGKKINDWRDLGDYKEIDGYMYPHTFTYNSRTGRQDGWIHSVTINPNISDDMFEIPEKTDLP